MRWLLALGLTLLLAAGPAATQGVVFDGSYVAPTPPPADSSNRIATTAFVKANQAGTSLPLNQIFVGNASNVATAVAMSGDCTIVASGAITCGAATGAALTKVDDANVTLTLGGLPATALVHAASITVNWAGTLAAGRLNSNVVQSIANDTNVTGSIAAQALTLGWTGNLSVPRGGTGLGTLTANGVLLGAGTGAVQFATIGTGGRLLIDQGAAVNPAFTAMSADATLAASGALTIANNAVTNAKSAQMGAATIKGNPTAAPANATDFTIQGLTARGAPDSANDKVPIYDNAAGTIKYVTPAQIAASATAGVSTFNGRAGSVVLQADDASKLNGLSLANNCTIAVTVATNNVTFAIKDNAGADPTASTPCVPNFANSTLTTSSTVVRPVTAATSLVLNAGSTLGAANAAPFRVWLTYIDTGAATVLGASIQSVPNVMFPLAEEGLVSTTACSACATATAAGTIYTTVAQTTKAFKIAGYAEWNTGLITAGTWATAPTAVRNFSAGMHKPGDTIQAAQMTTSTQTVNNTSTYLDTTCTRSMTPSSSVNSIYTSWTSDIQNSGASNVVIAALRRAGTVIGSPRAYYDAGTQVILSVGANWTDSPQTSALVTYTVAFKLNVAGTAVMPSGSGGCNLQIAEIMG